MFDLSPLAVGLLSVPVLVAYVHCVFSLCRIRTWKLEFCWDHANMLCRCSLCCERALTFDGNINLNVKFKCSTDQAKRSFCHAANSIFAKLGRLASEEVIIQLLKQTCLPILLYALEVYNLDKRSLQSLDFTVNRFFMKLFKTSNIEIVHYCQNMSGLQLPSVLLGSRYQKFLSDVPCDVYSWIVVVVSFFLLLILLPYGE